MEARFAKRSAFSGAPYPRNSRETGNWQGFQQLKNLPRYLELPLS
jgi:hypothetical protein